MKCQSVDCGFIAVYHVWWPGQPCRFCELCTRRAVKVAKVMGFELPFVDIAAVEAAAEQKRRIEDAVERLTGEKLPEPGQGGT